MAHSLIETSSGETLSPEEQIASEEALMPTLLTQPTARPLLPMVNGKPLHFASPAPEATKAAAPVRRAAKRSIYGDPAGKWFNYALLGLLLTCAATGVEMLISTTFR